MQFYYNKAFSNGKPQIKAADQLFPLFEVSDFFKNTTGL